MQQGQTQSQQSSMVIAARNIVFWLFIVGLGAYAMGGWALLIAHGLIGESVRPVRLFNEGIHLAVLPALVLVPACLLLRRWLLLGLLLPVALVALVWYVPYFLPKSTPVLAEDTTIIRIMTFNVLYTNRNFDDLVAVINNSGADIIAFQEFNGYIYPHIQERLREQYPEHACYTRMSKCIISKFPIERSDFWRLEFNAQQRAVINIDGRRLVVYNIHLYPLLAAQALERRDDDLDSIFRRINTQDANNTVLVLGDLNTGDRTGIYRRMTERFNDAWVEAGQGFGFTHGLADIALPFSRLDYVFYEDELMALSAEVLGQSGGSDHRPVLVELAWPQGDG